MQATLNLNIKQSILLVAIYFMIAGLFFTATNKVYISALPSLLSLVLFIPLTIMSRTLKVPAVTGLTLLFFLISIVNILFYHPASLLEFTFYRYDGNFIISYAPFLLLPFVCFTFDLDRLVRIFLITVFIVNIPAFIIFLQSNSLYYTTLYTSTNAAGGVYAIVCALLIGLIFHRPKILYLVIFLSLCLFLIATTSRGSILGLIAGFLAWIFWKKNRPAMTLLMLVSVILVQAVLISSFYGYYADSTGLHEYQEMTTGSYMDTKLSNIYIRLLYEWPAGADTFMRSPVLGYGFGSINDLPYTDSNLLSGLVERNSSANYVYSSAHAHHSYLHILGEQGIVGLLSILLMWAAIYRSLTKADGLPWLRDGLIIAFWTIIFASFTEHRLTTPSMILPFGLLFVLYYGWQCGSPTAKEGQGTQRVGQADNNAYAGRPEPA